MADHSHDPNSFAHPAPLKLLYGVFVALLALTVITVAVAKLDLPEVIARFDVWIAMGIASIKAFLVAAIFMHMWWDKPFNILVFLSSLLFVALFVGFTLMDTTHYRDQVEEFPASERPAKPFDPYNPPAPSE